MAAVVVVVVVCVCGCVGGWGVAVGMGQVPTSLRGIPSNVLAKTVAPACVVFKPPNAGTPTRAAK